MNTRFLNIENLSYPQLDELDRANTIFIQSISPLEEHGPHLPIGVDIFIADYMANRIADNILEKHENITVVMFPPLAIGVGAIPWLGSFNSRQRLIRSLVEERAAVLGKYGFRFFLLSNGHGGPRHVVALEEAAHRASKKYRLKVVSLSGRIAFEFLTGKYAAAIESKMGRSFTEEEKRCFAQDSHAGWWETSVMLMLKPELVDKNYQELSAFTKDWKNHFGRKKSVKDPGYRGFPALANRTFADATVHVLLEKLMELIEDMLQGKELGKRAYSPLYKLGFFRTNFIWYAVILFTIIITIVLIVLI